VTLAAVHTTGVNWESVAAIVGTLTGILALGTGWIGSLVRIHKAEIAGHIDGVARTIDTRLDNFEAHLGRQDQAVQSISVRVARLEGPLDRAVAGVQTISDAVNGGAGGEPSIRQNVEALLERKDLDPEKQ
jgi:hypothetical protein